MMGTSGRHSTLLPPPHGLVAGVGRELRATGLLLADNAIAAALPGLLFTMAACAHVGITGWSLVPPLATSTVLFAFYNYVSDAANQAVGVVEDMVNKPHRPVPRGLFTPRGLLVRFWCAMALYTLLGCLTGTLLWVLLWQVSVVVLNLLARPRDYLWVKPLCMLSGTVAQLAGAWQLAAPLEDVAWSWILVPAVGFILPLAFEDVRDMGGDAQLGRRTFALLVGHWPVRVWFALIVAALPLPVYTFMLAPSPTDGPVVAACTVVITALMWTAVARSLLLRDVRADRVTYRLYTLTYAATIACGPVLL
ncbi:UbiA family prenyltransferase [Streptomyces sp. NPDC046465]|uniref:UbiA family prenyltransferase n=1 Tax=Streptomyces sp. NPDC046465 TaxID=3155810 RepID=UPI0033F6DD8C